MSDSRQRGRLRSKRALAAIGPAIGSRVLFGAAFASYAAISLTASDSALVFQLLFLQGGLIALLSASGYARGAQIGSRAGGLARTFRRYVGFLLLASALSILAGGYFLQAPGVTDQSRIWTIALLTVGAACSALNGLVQGIAVVLSGALHAFVPTLLANALGFAALGVFWNTDSIVGATIMWVAPQCLAPIGVLVASAQVRTLIITPEDRLADGDNFALIGVVNTASVGAVYQVRERWSEHHNPEVVATTFYVTRLTELLYQVFYMGLASLPQLTRRFAARISTSRSLGIALVAGGTIYAAACWLLFALWGDWSTSRIITAEALLIPLRVLASAAILTLLSRRSTMGYIVSIGVSAVLALGMSNWAGFTNFGFGLQAYQLVASVVAIVAMVIICRHPDDPETGDTPQGPPPASPVSS